jgi:hypothetical protein
MAWVLGLKAAAYYHGVHQDAPERRRQHGRSVEYLRREGVLP